MTPKIALVYDRVNTPFGGAEHVLRALHALYPQAPLYTSVYDPKAATWAAGWDIRPGFVQQLPWAKQAHRWLVPLMPLVFEQHNFTDADIVISITSAEAKGVLTKPHQLHICYLLTPTRYLWSHESEYVRGPFAKGIRFFFRYLRWWDEAAALRPDAIIPISKHVATRCATYYHRQTESVIYPTLGLTPVGEEGTQVSSPVAIQAQTQASFLVVARLVAYKKIDLVIAACAQVGVPLVIVGTGPEKNALERLAKRLRADVQFVGDVSDHELQEYYRQALGFVAPGEEDFGITVLEALRRGKPVIVYHKSGVAELVQEGKTGILLHEQSVAAVAEALHMTRAFSWDSAAIAASVGTKSQLDFQQKFRHAVEYLWKQFQEEKGEHNE